MTVSLEISLFGTCIVRLKADEVTEIRGSKHRALISILATAPLGRRTRTFLQNTLWGYSGYDCGHQNLRRALSDLRKLIGPHFDTIFHTTNTDVELDLHHVRFVGDLSSGEFLEDLNVVERDFQDWVASIRANPSQIAALYRNTPTWTMRRPRPCVTMLPLNQLGDDPVLRALGDWIGEQACRVISRSNFLNVISHLSGRAVAQERTVVTEVRQALGVDYLTTGFIRRAGSGVSCDIDFIEAETGRILWSKNFHLNDVNNLDDAAEQLDSIARSVARSIADSAVESVRVQPLNDIADHNLIIAGVSMMHRVTMGDFLKSREFLSEAASRLPDAADAHAWLGKWYVLNVMKGYSLDRKSDTRMALECTARSLDIDPESSLGLTIDGFVNSNLVNDFDAAEKRFDAALTINPNESLAWLLRGSLMAFSDHGDAAVMATLRARSLSPVDPFGYYYDSLASTAHLAANKFEDSLKFAERSLRANSRNISTHRAKITALHFLGRSKEAQEAAETLQKFRPDFCLSRYRQSHPVAQRRLGRQVIEALAASGIE